MTWCLKHTELFRNEVMSLLYGAIQFYNQQCYGDKKSLATYMTPIRSITSAGEATHDLRTQNTIENHLITSWHHVCLILLKSPYKHLKVTPPSRSRSLATSNEQQSPYPTC